MDTAREQTAALAALLRREHDALADFLVALADFDARRVWAELGQTSLFWFLHRELGLSKGAAQYRKTAAELVQRVPEIVEPLRDGHLCLSSIVELAHVITPENQAEVLPRFFRLSRKEAAALVAELRPVEAPSRREVVTRVRVSAPAAATMAEPPSPVTPSSEADAGWLADLPDANSPADGRVLLSRLDEKPDVAGPLTADLRRFHVTVS